MTTTRNKEAIIKKKAGRLFLLAAIGYGIALLGQIPNATWFSFYSIDLSDLRTVFVYALYGFFPSVFVILFKSAMVALTFFERLCLPFPLYPIATALNSLVLLLFLTFFDRICHVFSKGLPGRLYGYLRTRLFTSAVFGYFSFLFILPTRVNGNHLTSIFTAEPNRDLRNSLSPSFFLKGNPYRMTAFLYGIFYSLRINACIFFFYELVCNPLIFRKRKSPVLGSKVFITERDLEHFSPFDSIKEKAIQLGEDKIHLQNKINKRNRSLQENNTIHKDVNRNEYAYFLHIDEFGVRREVKLSSLVHSSALILAYLTNIYPKQNYKILSYESLGDNYADASTDGLSKKVFYQIHHCDKITTYNYSVSIRVR